MITIAKNHDEEIRIGTTTYKGHDFIDVRVYYCHHDGDWRPGKKGLMLRPELWLQIVDAVQVIASTGE